MGDDAEKVTLHIRGIIGREANRIVRDYEARNGVRGSKMRKMFFQLVYCYFCANGICWMNAKLLTTGVRNNQPILAHEIDGMVCKQT